MGKQGRSDMTDSNEEGPLPIDLNVPRISRVRNALTGGEANFQVDRKVADALVETSPFGAVGLKAVLEALDQFVTRALRTVADESEVRQFLHIGTATPSTGMVHERVVPLIPDARVVYASHDATTLAHVHGLRRDRPDGAVGHVHSSFTDPERILQGAAEMLDLSIPVTAILPTSLNIVNDEVAQNLVDALRNTLVPGSYVVLAETSLDIPADGTEKVIALLNTMLDEPYVARPREQIAGHLAGFDLLEPGLVPIEAWRSDGAPPFLENGQQMPFYGAVGLRP
jgi:hypothetical protein